MNRTDMEVARDLCILKHHLLKADMAPTALLIAEAAEHLVRHAVRAALEPRGMIPPDDLMEPVRASAPSNVIPFPFACAIPNGALR
jgi:hypothetical protein